jgi:oxygen-independent coproporphyrinogen-3 oxidase
MLSENDRIPPMDRDTERIMLGLRTVRGLDPKEYEARFRRRFTCFLPFLAQCRQAGYAVEEAGRWRLTPRGFLVSNQIIGGMLDALAAEKKRRADAAARGDFRVRLD